MKQMITKYLNLNNKSKTLDVGATGAFSQEIAKKYKLTFIDLHEALFKELNNSKKLFYLLQQFWRQYPRILNLLKELKQYFQPFVFIKPLVVSIPSILSPSLFDNLPFPSGFKIKGRCINSGVFHPKASYIN